MPTTHNDGYDIDYEVDGSGDGPRLVFAHGLMGTGATQRTMLSPLVEAGWTVATFNQRGHGSSTPVRDAAGYDPDAMGADLWAVADALGWDRCWIGGGSMGAATSFCAARNTSDRVEGLIQAVPALKSTPHELNWVFDGLADRVRDAGIEGLIETIAEFGQQMGRTEPDLAFQEELRSHRDPSSIEIALRTVPNWCIADIPSALGTFGFPVIVQGWDNDPIHPLAFAKECAAAAGVDLLELDQNDVMDDRTAVGRAYVERLAAVATA